jgi:hypothetical protein
VPATTTPSRGIFFTGLHEQNFRDAHVIDADPRLLAAAAHNRLGRREIHQRTDRVPRAIHAAGLENLRKRKQERHRRAL